VLTPNVSTNTGDFKDNLTFMFKDPEWGKKGIIGALLNLIPIVNFVTTGYALETLNNVREDRQPILPDWSVNFGDYFMKGLVVVVFSLLYALPMIIVSGILGGIGSAAGGGVGTFFNAIAGLISFVYSIALIFWMQGALINYAVKNSFGAAFEFTAILDLVRGNLGRLIMTVVIWVVGGVAIGVLAAVLMVIPCLGWIADALLFLVAAFYLMLVMAYNCGIVAKQLAAPMRPQPAVGSDWEHL
jgi:hypothetical protein